MYVITKITLTDNTSSIDTFIFVYQSFEYDIMHHILHLSCKQKNLKKKLKSLILKTLAIDFIKIERQCKPATHPSLGPSRIRAHVLLVNTPSTVFVFSFVSNYATRHLCTHVRSFTAIFHLETFLKWVDKIIQKKKNEKKLNNKTDLSTPPVCTFLKNFFIPSKQTFLNKKTKTKN